MARFLVDGHPDPDLFAGFVAALVPAGGRRPVSAFGEMVALLWERGEVAAALELESLWNTVIARHPVRLLCAYSGDLLADAELADVAPMCGLHDHVSLAGPHPGSGGTDSGRRRRPLQRAPACPRGGRLCSRLRA